MSDRILSFSFRLINFSSKAFFAEICGKRLGFSFFYLCLTNFHINSFFIDFSGMDWFLEKAFFFNLMELTFEEI